MASRNNSRMEKRLGRAKHGRAKHAAFPPECAFFGALATLLVVGVLLTLLNDAIKTHKSSHLSFVGVTKVDAPS